MNELSYIVMYIYTNNQRGGYPKIVFHCHYPSGKCGLPICPSNSHAAKWDKDWLDFDLITSTVPSIISTSTILDAKRWICWCQKFPLKPLTFPQHVPKVSQGFSHGDPSTPSASGALPRYSDKQREEPKLAKAWRKMERPNRSMGNGWFACWYVLSYMYMVCVIYVYIYIYTYVCMYVCLSVCMYVCMYFHVFNDHKTNNVFGVSDSNNIFLQFAVYDRGFWVLISIRSSLLFTPP